MGDMTPGSVIIAMETYDRKVSDSKDYGATRSLVGASGGYSTRQIHLYVSPQGNDAWPGSQKQPKATLMGARDAVRQLKSGGGLTDPVHVKFADGEYLLMEPVTFTPQDNGTETTPVIYEAMEGARPVFSGGRKNGRFPARGKWLLDCRCAGCGFGPVVFRAVVG